MKTNYWMIGLVFTMLILPRQAILSPRESQTNSDSDGDMDQFDFLMEALEMIKDQLPPTLQSIIVSEHQCVDRIQEINKYQALKSKPSLTEEEKQAILNLKIAIKNAKKKCREQKNQILIRHLAKQGLINVFSVTLDPYQTELHELAQAETALKQMMKTERQALDHFLQVHKNFKDQRRSLLEQFLRQAAELKEKAEDILRRKKDTSQRSIQLGNQPELQRSKEQIEQQIKEQEEKLKQIEVEIEEESRKLREQQKKFRQKAKNRKKQRRTHSLQMQVANFMQIKQRGSLTKEQCENLNILIQKLVSETQIGDGLAKMREIYEQECLPRKTPQDSPIQPRSPHPKSPSPEGPHPRSPDQGPKGPKSPGLVASGSPGPKSHLGQLVPISPTQPTLPKALSQQQKQAPQAKQIEFQRRVKKFALAKISSIMSVADQQNGLNIQSCKKLSLYIENAKQLQLEETQRALLQRSQNIFKRFCGQIARKLEMISRMQKLTKERVISQDQCEEIKEFVDKMFQLIEKAESQFTENEHFAARNLQLLYNIQCQYKAGQLQSALMSAQKETQEEGLTGRIDLRSCDQLKAILTTIEENVDDLRQEQHGFATHFKRMYFIYCEPLQQEFTPQILGIKTNNMIMQLKQESLENVPTTHSRCLEIEQLLNELQKIPKQQISIQMTSMKAVLSLEMSERCSEFVQQRFQEERKRQEINFKIKFQEERKRQEIERKREKIKQQLESKVARCEAIMQKFKEVQCEQMHDLLEAIQPQEVEASEEVKARISSTKGFYQKKCLCYIKLLECMEQAKKPRAKTTETNQGDDKKIQKLLDKINVYKPVLKPKRKQEVQKQIASLEEQLKLKRFIFINLNTLVKSVKEEIPLDEAQYYQIKGVFAAKIASIKLLIEENFVQKGQQAINLVEQKILLLSHLRAIAAHFTRASLSSKKKTEIMKKELQLVKIVSKFRDFKIVIAPIQQLFRMKQNFFKNQAKKLQTAQGHLGIEAKIKELAQSINQHKNITNQDRKVGLDIIHFFTPQKLTIQEEENFSLIKVFLTKKRQGSFYRSSKFKPKMPSISEKTQSSDLKKQFQETVEKENDEKEQNLPKSPNQLQKQDEKK